MGDLLALQQQAFATVSRVLDDPEGRYDLRVRFYENYGDELAGDAGFGNSELAFMRWEIDRGVLNPLQPQNGARPGSDWWRGVNASLLYDAELAALIAESGQDYAAPADTQRWLDYIDRKTEESWYLAHNGSIVAGYLKQVAAARAEEGGEQSFMNIVLYRVLFAQAMVAKQTFLGRLGQIVADPMFPAVKIIVDVRDFYPREYPLTPADIRRMSGRGDSLLDLAVRIFDEGIILREAQSIYDHAATSLGIPELTRLFVDGRPIYPTL
ncbi:MAG TPA: hypothetical protein VGL86_33175 [Polyangia bacterium]|jgi:hypothetical protein